MIQKNEADEKNGYQKLNYQYKLSIITKIHNGQMSARQAAKKYQVSPSTVSYWMKQYSNFDTKTKGMAKNDEIKKLKEEIEKLKFMKDLQQTAIAEMELITGTELSKKSLPESLAKEIAKKKQLLSK